MTPSKPAARLLLLLRSPPSTLHDTRPNFSLEVSFTIPLQSYQILPLPLRHSSNPLLLPSNRLLHSPIQIRPLDLPHQLPFLRLLSSLKTSQSPQNPPRLSRVTIATLLGGSESIRLVRSISSLHPHLRSRVNLYHQTSALATSQVM